MEGLLRFLLALKHFYSIKGDIYRSRAYEMAIKSLEGVDVEKLLDGDIYVAGIGHGIKKKIALWFDNRKECEKFIEEVDRMNEIFDILGIGRRFGMELINKWNVKKYEDVKALLKEKPDMFTRMQKIGIKYHLDLQKKVSRKYVEGATKEIVKYFHPKVYEIVGSYRRGLNESSDIDLLMIEPKNVPNEEVCIIVSSGETKYLLLWKYAGQWVHVDIRIVKKNEWIPALLYFTGSRIHNMQIRMRAKAMGFKLNEYGLFRNDKLILLKKEEDLYKILKLEYISPDKR